MTKDVRVYLAHILESIDKIERFTADGRDRFLRDPMVHDAVVRNLEIIGEAARNTPDEVTHAHPEIPWEKMRGIRNLLAHEYFGVDVSIVWLTATADLPPLVPLLRAILGERTDAA